MNKLKHVIAGMLILLSGTISLAQGGADWILPLLPNASEPDAVQKLLDNLADTDLRIGENLQTTTFDSANVWENYSTDEGYARVEDAHYHVVSNEVRAPVWGQNEIFYENVLIEVETEQISTIDNNGYGLMCRASEENNGVGYYFFVSGDGFYRIAVVDDGAISNLVEWTATDLIAQGQARNHIAALCYEDRLALFINNRLAAEVRDTTLDAGALGLFGWIYEEDEDIEIHFDNLRVWSVQEKSALPEELAADLSQGSTFISVDNLLLNQSFDDDNAWNGYNNGMGVELDVASGIYRAVTNRGEGLVYWGLGLKEYTDVIIQVETSDNSEQPNNGYGLTCRSASMNDSTGYYLLISGDGFYQIMRALDGTFEQLVPWTRSNVIALEGDNTLTAVCAGDYLALYVNGTLLAEYTDTGSALDSGFVGMSIIGYEDEGVVAEVAFDNYRIWVARQSN